MQQTMKQYITAMRINHVRALLSDTDKTIRILPAAGFAPAVASTALLPATWACRRSSTVNSASSGVTAWLAGGIKCRRGFGGMINSENG